MHVPTTAAQERAFITRSDHVILWRPDRPFPDDRPWISNKFWLLPAGLFNGAAKDWNLSFGTYGPDQGIYRPDGKALVRTEDVSDGIAELMAELLDPEQYPAKLTTVTVPGLDAPALVEQPNRVDGALYAVLDNDGRPVLVDAEMLAVARLAQTVALPYGVRYEDVTLRQREPRTDGGDPTLQAVALVAERSVERGGIIPEPGRYEPKRGEADGEHVIAVVMPARLPRAD